MDTSWKRLGWFANIGEVQTFGYTLDLSTIAKKRSSACKQFLVDLTAVRSGITIIWEIKAEGSLQISLFYVLYTPTGKFCGFSFPD